MMNNRVQCLGQTQLLCEIVNNTNFGKLILYIIHSVLPNVCVNQPHSSKCSSLKRGEKAFVYTTINGKIMPIRKKEVQLIEPEIMYAAGRSVWVNISVVKMFVTPPTAQSTFISLIKLVCVYTSVCQCTQQ